MRFLLACFTILTAITAIPVWSQSSSQSRSQAQAKTDDGPYVLWEGDTASVHWVKDGKHEMENFRPPFLLLLPGLAQTKLVLDGKPYPKAKDEISNPKKIFAVSDVHGAFDVMRNLLIAHKVIDSKNRWIFGKGHLVIAGDVADRGDHMTEAYWFVRALEEGAAKARGGVHLLIGNHEEMLLSGDYRYLNPLYTSRVEGMPDLAQLWGSDSEIGKWIRSRPVMMKFGDTLFLHGGVSPEFLARDMDIAAVNREMRFVPREERNDLDKFLLGSSGPLWYRGLILGDQQNSVSQSDLDKILAHFKVKRIAVGHTTVVNASAFHDGKVIAIDAGIQHGRSEGVFFQKKKVFRAIGDGSKVEIK
ncbi:MAG: metallophosphoesterase [Holophagaceae bacterium]|nr:metallophosphoesterase [Holophagaceae bacterium]